MSSALAQKIATQQLATAELMEQIDFLLPLTNNHPGPLLLTREVGQIRTVSDSADQCVKCEYLAVKCGNYQRCLFGASGM